jgi:hypothetical protein
VNRSVGPSRYEGLILLSLLLLLLVVQPAGLGRG